MQNYLQLVERIARYSGLTKEEISRKVEAKRAKLAGLISKEGAAQIVAAELGISFDKEKMKISELLTGMRRVNVIGKIIDMFPVRSYVKNSREGKIGSFILADETGNIRVVLWDTNHIELIEQEKIKKGDVVEITAAAVRNAELHLTGFSDIKISQEVIEDVKTEQVFYDKRIEELKVGENVKVRAIIVQIFEPRFFEVCPECGMRVTNDVDGSKCPGHGKVLPVKRALVSLILDDGSENIRAVLFNEQMEKLGIEADSERFFEKRDDILGKEAFFSGRVRQNKLFNNLEFFVSDIQEIEVEELIKSLGRESI